MTVALRKLYRVNLNPDTIKALDAYIIKEKKRAFYDEGNWDYALKCWKRWFIIEKALKNTKSLTFINLKETNVARKSYAIKLDPNVVNAFDFLVLTEKTRWLSKNSQDSLNHWHRNKSIEQVIEQLIKE